MRRLISVLIPAYNAAPWLRATIESVLAQTWTNLEVIVVDDGSTDATLTVARSFVDKRLLVTAQANQGASRCRNAALRLAQGDYIQWLDADDLLLSDKITNQLRVAESCSTRTMFSSSWGHFFYRPGKASYRPNSLWEDLSPKQWLMRKFSNNHWMASQAWLVSRELTDLAGPWDSSLTMDDDGEYFSRLIHLGDQVKFVPEARSLVRRATFGTLSTGRMLSRGKLESQCRSILLQIKYLRALEDSEATRAACRSYLQTWLLYFYPECPDIVEQLRAVAVELGGDLPEPQLPLRYDLLRRVFGWGVAKKARFFLPEMKAKCKLTVDKWLACMESK